MKTAKVTQRTQSKFKGKKLQKQNKNKKQEKNKRIRRQQSHIDRDAAVTVIATGYIYWKLEYCKPAPLSGFGFHHHLLV